MLDWPGDCHLVLCFLVFECFSMFHVKHDVFTTTHLFHVKRGGLFGVVVVVLWVGIVLLSWLDEWSCYV